VEQLQLLLRDKKKEVSEEVVLSCATFKDALRLCKSISGLEDKQICMPLDIDAGQWARIFGNGGHFPENKLIEYMELCGNKVPLIWLALVCGYTLTPLKTELEIELDAARAENEELKKKYDHTIEALKAVNA
jgi:hypothetical protein